MYQLSNSPDLSGSGGEGFSRVGELAEELGEALSGDEGGEGGCAGRSLCRGLIWRMNGRPSSLLVNRSYYMGCQTKGGGEREYGGAGNELQTRHSYTPCFPFSFSLV